MAGIHDTVRLAVPLPAPVLGLLPEAGAWLVGGAVRDLIMGRPLKDLDLAVAGNATALAASVATATGGTLVPLNAASDTARVVIPGGAPGDPPLELDFTAVRAPTIEEDLALRDFTLNALALTLDGRLLDVTGGRHDLEHRILRMTGPRAFLDDPLRLVRLFRLAAELGCVIDEATLDLVAPALPGLDAVATERVTAELVRILLSDVAAGTLGAMAEHGLLRVILPPVGALASTVQSSPHFYPDVLRHTLATVEAAASLRSLLRTGALPPPSPLLVPPAWAWPDARAALEPLRPELASWLDEPVGAGLDRAALLVASALLHDIGKPATRTVDDAGMTHFHGHESSGGRIASDLLTALRFPARAAAFVAAAVSGHMRPMTLDPDSVPGRRTLHRFYRDTREAGVGVVLLFLADTLGVRAARLQPERWRDALALAVVFLEAWFLRSAEVVRPPALVTGRDLLALGVPPGPSLGRLLGLLYEAQAAGQVLDREQMLSLARDLAPIAPASSGGSGR